MLGWNTRKAVQPERNRAAAEPRRRSPRLGQQDRQAVLRWATTNAKLSILNLSQNGVMGECRTPLNAGDRIEIVLEDRDPVPATTLWVKGRRFGAAFDTALPYEALWPPAAVRRGAQRVRTQAERVLVDAVATVQLDGMNVQGRIRDVSVRGVLIEIATQLTPGHVVELGVDGWPVVKGVVMWNSDGRAGLFLEQPLTEEQMLDLVVSR